MPRLVYVVTHPSSARVLLTSQAAHMRSRGFDVVVIASPGEELPALAEQGVATTVGIPIFRQIRPFNDLVTLVKLYWTSRRAVTPRRDLVPER